MLSNRPRYVFYSQTACSLKCEAPIAPNLFYTMKYRFFALSLLFLLVSCTQEDELKNTLPQEAAFGQEIRVAPTGFNPAIFQTSQLAQSKSADIITEVDDYLQDHNLSFTTLGQPAWGKMINVDGYIIIPTVKPDYQVSDGFFLLEETETGYEVMKHLETIASPDISASHLVMALTAHLLSDEAAVDFPYQDVEIRAIKKDETKGDCTVILIETYFCTGVSSGGIELCCNCSLVSTSYEISCSSPGGGGPVIGGGSDGNGNEGNSGSGTNNSTDNTGDSNGSPDFGPDCRSWSYTLSTNPTYNEFRWAGVSGIRFTYAKPNNFFVRTTYTLPTLYFYVPTYTTWTGPISNSSASIYSAVAVQNAQAQLRNLYPLTYWQLPQDQATEIIINLIMHQMNILGGGIITDPDNIFIPPTIITQPYQTRLFGVGMGC